MLKCWHFQPKHDSTHHMTPMFLKQSISIDFHAKNAKIKKILRCRKHLCILDPKASSQLVPRFLGVHFMMGTTLKMVDFD